MRQNIQDLLEERLAVSPHWLQARLAKIEDPDVLRILLRRAATVDSVAEFEQALDTLITP